MSKTDIKVSDEIIDLYSIKSHGDSHVLYFGRNNQRHGLNLVTLTDKAFNCDYDLLQALLNKGCHYDALVEQNKALIAALEGLCCSPHTRLTKHVLLEVSEADIDAAIKALEQAK